MEKDLRLIQDDRRRALQPKKVQQQLKKDLESVPCPYDLLGTSTLRVEDVNACLIGFINPLHFWPIQLDLRNPFLAEGVKLLPLAGCNQKPQLIPEVPTGQSSAQIGPHVLF